MLRAVLSPPSPARVFALLAGGFALALALVEGLAAALGVAPTLGLHVALGVVAFELGLVLALAVAPRRHGRATSTGTPRVSVLVAAWNEAPVIARTVSGLLTQTDVELEIIVADDGSTDGTSREVPRDPRVRLVRIAHAGKGAALEAARAIALHPIVVTVDADTALEPLALRRIADAFADGAVVAAGGAVLVRGADDVFSRAQLCEYQRTTWMRAGWAALGVLEQIPGAFSAFRREALEAADGFPVDSLTEDYEITYRIRRAYRGRPIEVALVPSARAWTEPPRTLPAFVRQRTRWFAGFLSTLFRFRALVLDPGAGAFGLVRLPVKVLDAVLPVGLLLSLGFVVVGAARGEPLVSELGAALLALRVVEAALVYAAADRLRVGAAGRHPDEPDRASAWLTAILDPLAFAWLRAVVVLRAYPFALGRVRTWERSRPLEAPVPASDVADAPAE